MYHRSVDLLRLRCRGRSERILAGSDISSTYDCLRAIGRGEEAVCQWIGCWYIVSVNTGKGVQVKLRKEGKISSGIPLRQNRDVEYERWNVKGIRKMNNVGIQFGIQFGR